MNNIVDLIALLLFPFLLIGALIAIYYSNKWRIEYLYNKYKKEHPEEYNEYE